MVLHTHGKTFSVGGGGAFYDKDCWLACLAPSVPRLRCFMPYQKAVCPPFRPTRVSSSSVLSDRFSFSHFFPLLSPDISGFDGVEKRRRRRETTVLCFRRRPHSFSPSGSPAAIVRVFVPAPFLLKRRKRKKLGGENCTAVGLGEDFSASPSFLPILRCPLFLSFPCPFLLFFSLCPPFFLHFFC